MIEQILGWIGTVLFFYGVFALAKKSTKGFYVNGLGNILYSIQAILMENWPLLACSIGLAFINIYGIYQWKIKKSKSSLTKKAELNYSRSVADLYKENDV